MVQDLQEMKLRIQKELDAYIADNSTAKALFSSMKEMTEWLKSQEK